MPPVTTIFLCVEVIAFKFYGCSPRVEDALLGEYSINASCERRDAYSTILNIAEEISYRLLKWLK